MIELGIIACLVYAWYAHANWAEAKAEEIKELKADKEWWKAKTKAGIAIADDSQRSVKEYLDTKSR